MAGTDLGDAEQYRTCDLSEAFLTPGQGAVPTRRSLKRIAARRVP
jgi:hypothetical protein